MKKPELTELEWDRARAISTLILDAHEDCEPIPVVQGVDALNLANVVEMLSRCFDTHGSHENHLDGATEEPASPRTAPRAGEVIPPHRRASHWKKPIAGIDR